MKLIELEKNKSAYITDIKSNGLMRRRLLDLGFVPGSKVTANMSGPLGDPVAYEICGSLIALRRSDTAKIDISFDNPCREEEKISLLKKENKENISGTDEKESKFSYVIALAGNPNTGKSTVFNALTGLRQHVGNWPGKTVARAEGWWTYENWKYRLVDLPGTYSLLSASKEEEIARNFILFSAPDCTVIVIDATCMERNLNLVFQILEITDRAIVCVNLIDEAKRKGIKINRDYLEKSLGVPVVFTAARTGYGLSELKEKIYQIATGKLRPYPVRIEYDREIQEAVNDLVPMIKESFPLLPNPEWVALRLIDGADNSLRESLLEGRFA